jgi:hypothetical protein
MLGLGLCLSLLVSVFGLTSFCFEVRLHLKLAAYSLTGGLSPKLALNLVSLASSRKFVVRSEAHDRQSKRCDYASACFHPWLR